MRTQVDEGIVVLVGIVAYRIADAVGYIVLQPALFYGKHFIESIVTVDADGRVTELLFNDLVPLIGISSSLSLLSNLSFL